MQSWNAQTTRGASVAPDHNLIDNAGSTLNAVGASVLHIRIRRLSAASLLGLSILFAAEIPSFAQSETPQATLPDAPDSPSSLSRAFVDKSSYTGAETPLFLLASIDQSSPDSQNTPPPAASQTAEPATSQQTTPPTSSGQAEGQKPGAASGVAPELKGNTQLGQEQVKKQEKQRILGVIPAFNSVYEGSVPPLTPGQKFRLMFKSTTDAYVFAFAAVTAGIGQAQNSHAGYGQGVEGYAKRFGANYVDTADGNFWGNAVLPIVLHEDPRYFRLGQGSFRHRLLYSMSTTVWCKRDDGSSGPNYANVMGNLIAGGISNVYYPAADRGLGQTFQSAATVTAEGMIGAALIEFWPDIAAHHNRKRQAKQDAADAAARNAQQAQPLPIAPQ
jgi:hypothetical protein